MLLEAAAPAAGPPMDGPVSPEAGCWKRLALAHPCASSVKILKNGGDNK